MSIRLDGDTVSLRLARAISDEERSDRPGLKRLARLVALVREVSPDLDARAARDLVRWVLHRSRFLAAATPTPFDDLVLLALDKWFARSATTCPACGSRVSPTRKRRKI